MCEADCITLDYMIHIVLEHNLIHSLKWLWSYPLVKNAVFLGLKYSAIKQLANGLQHAQFSQHVAVGIAITRVQLG